MAEILALVAIVLAIAAMNRNGKNGAKLAEEIRKLRLELDAMRAGGAVVLDPAEHAAAEAGAISAAKLAQDRDGVSVDPGEAPLGGSAGSETGPFARPWQRQRSDAGAGSGVPLQPAAGTMTASAVSGVEAAEVGRDGRRGAVGNAADADISAGAAPVRESLESRIGARWAVWVGGLALALGGVFMVKYAIESGVLSPAVRLALAALFGLVLVSGGEVIRRRGRLPAAGAFDNRFHNAMVPGVLTAAGTLTLFAVTYAAHAFYGFVGTGPAFGLLALIALAAIALSLLHGQALAGLGLLGSMATPLLVNSAEPDPRSLFAYLAIAWLATTAAARLRNWQAVPVFANVGMGLWALLYLAAADTVQVMPVTLALLVMLAGTALVWPGGAAPEAGSAGIADRVEDLPAAALGPAAGTGRPSEASQAASAVASAAADTASAATGSAASASATSDGDAGRSAARASAEATGDGAVAADGHFVTNPVPDPSAEESSAAFDPARAAAASARPPAASRSGTAHWQRLLAPAYFPVSLSAALMATLPAIVLAFLHPLPSSAATAFAVLALVIALLGAGRPWAFYPAVFGNLCALAGTMVLAGLSGRLALETLAAFPDQPGFDAAIPFAAAGAAPVGLILLLAAGLAAAGAVAIRLWHAAAPPHAALCGVLMAVFPVAVAAVGFVAFGNLSRDLAFGLFALALGLAYFGGAELHSRQQAGAIAAVPQWTLVAGGFAFLVLALFALTDGLATTLLIALLGFAMVLSTRVRPWPVLPWMMVAAGLVTAMRIGWEPTIVGAAGLSRTPVFNQLLAGYGIPALLMALSAYLLRRWPGERVRNLLQALASLFVLLAVAILVRHAMNGGVLDSTAPTLGEQAIYTLLAAGASAVLMTLDLKQPSPVFRYGSMTVGVLSMLSILSLHFFALNPYFTGELTGRWPVFNLLLVGYLLPGTAFAGLAWYARGRRPAAYVTLLALTGAALVFAWVSLSVRRYWHGEGIAGWKGFLQGETYTYSVVWLLLGVGLLVLGSRFDAKSLRLASAALVLIAVVKAFLIDMSNLEGILRALSFIGLGAVLIGIGLFYQRILSARGGREPPAEPARPGTA